MNRTPLYLAIQQKAEKIQDEVRELVRMVETQQVAQKSGIEVLMHGEITRDTASRRKQLGLDT